MKKYYFNLIALCMFADCIVHAGSLKQVTAYDSDYQTIHVFVSLCDNKYQGIVPVPAKIGNGQDQNNNLYWGCAYGIRTYFKKSKEWILVKSTNQEGIILERLVFKHKTKKYYLIADAYDGKQIKQCTIDFLHGSSGQWADTIQLGTKIIGIAGNARLLAYIGHDGLMDFKLSQNFVNEDNKKRDVIVLACVSKKYFAPYLKTTNASPLLWTTGFMAPEAYTLHDALTGYVNNESAENIMIKAAKAYAAYQKCGVNAARKLLVTGW